MSWESHMYRKVTDLWPFICPELRLHVSKTIGLDCYRKNGIALSQIYINITRPYSKRDYDVLICLLSTLWSAGLTHPTGNPRISSLICQNPHGPENVPIV